MGNSSGIFFVTFLAAEESWIVLRREGYISIVFQFIHRAPRSLNGLVGEDSPQIPLLLDSVLGLRALAQVGTLDATVAGCILQGFQYARWTGLNRRSFLVRSGGRSGFGKSFGTLFCLVFSGKYESS